MRGSFMPGLWLSPAVTFMAPLDPGAGVLTSPVVEHVAEVDIAAGRRRSHGDMVSAGFFLLCAAGLASTLTVPFIVRPGPRRR